MTPLCPWESWCTRLPRSTQVTISMSLCGWVSKPLPGFTTSSLDTSSSPKWVLRGSKWCPKENECREFSQDVLVWNRVSARRRSISGRSDAGALVTGRAMAALLVSGTPPGGGVQVAGVRRDGPRRPPRRRGPARSVVGQPVPEGPCDPDDPLGLHGRGRPSGVVDRVLALGVHVAGAVRVAVDELRGVRVAGAGHDASEVVDRVVQRQQRGLLPAVRAGGGGEPAVGLVLQQSLLPVPAQRVD